MLKEQFEPTIDKKSTKDTILNKTNLKRQKLKTNMGLETPTLNTTQKTKVYHQLKPNQQT